MSEEKKEEFVFNFKEGQEKLPLNERVIEKRGSIQEFTMIAVENDINKFLKMIRENTANLKVQESILSNVDMHHPFVKEMSEFDRTTVHMYQESFSKAKAYRKVLDSLNSQFEEYIVEIGDIKEQIPELKDIEALYKKCMSEGCETLMERGGADYCPEHTAVNKVATGKDTEPDPHYNGPMGKYKISGKAEYTDETGEKKGELEIGSTVELPSIVGEQFVKDGVAEEVKE